MCFHNFVFHREIHNAFGKVKKKIKRMGNWRSHLSLSMYLCVKCLKVNFLWTVFGFDNSYACTRYILMWQIAFNLKMFISVSEIMWRRCRVCVRLHSARLLVHHKSPNQSFDTNWSIWEAWEEMNAWISAYARTSSNFVCLFCFNSQQTTISHQKWKFTYYIFWNGCGKFVKQTNRMQLERLWQIYFRFVNVECRKYLESNLQRC